MEQFNFTKTDKVFEPFILTDIIKKGKENEYIDAKNYITLYFQKSISGKIFMYEPSNQEIIKIKSINKKIFIQIFECVECDIMTIKGKYIILFNPIEWFFKIYNVFIDICNDIHKPLFYKNEHGRILYNLCKQNLIKNKKYIKK